MVVSLCMVLSLLIEELLPDMLLPDMLLPRAVDGPSGAGGALGFGAFGETGAC
ncbi:hypothetical protein [Cupriavidus pauculus]|uniref:hypothetical protein n=1 Tax=Cupriavidus pauculus TaxID=82633 RepID=UPI001478CAE5|nr:hypothetical protein [Cupriavidus pauculus]MCM3605516.1 hypothetical protein [Cupriavidus pauculus]UAL02489.1 hypothetical protein K8O84_27470 [Cupriavidus pauculus]